MWLSECVACQGVYVAHSSHHQLNLVINGIKNMARYGQDQCVMYLLQLDESDNLIGSRDDVR